MDLTVLYGGLPKFRSYLFDGYCKTEARIWICLLECLTMQCNLFVNKGIIVWRLYGGHLNVGPTSLMVIGRLRLEFGFSSSYIICLQQDQSCSDYISDSLEIGSTPLVVLARLKLIWRTI